MDKGLTADKTELNKSINNYINVEVQLNGETTYRRERIWKKEEVPFYHMMMHCKVSWKKNISRLEIPCAFDIETTNIYKRDEKGRISKDLRPYSFMYHWQFCIDGYVIFGRTWEEFQSLLKYISDQMHLSEDNRLVIYVHNLGFEFQHMRRFFNIVEGFYKDKYKPLKVVTGDGFEFRDSYALSNMSLAKFCENSEGVIHYKLEDTYDYKKIRTPATPLTEEELAYCYNDVAGLVECIRFRMQEDTLQTMPMTSTGYVRRDLRSAMRKDKRYRRKFLQRQLSPELYKMFREAFRGGNTHANSIHADKILPDPDSILDNEQSKVNGEDITSSYPTQILLRPDYPIGTWHKRHWGSIKRLDPDLNDQCYIFHCGFVNLEYIGDTGIPYIPLSHCRHVRGNFCVHTKKCIWNIDGHCTKKVEGKKGKCKYKKNVINDNGRVLKAKVIEITLTEIDYKIICREYKFTAKYVKDIYSAQKGPLPEELRNVCLEYFKGKTLLKGVPGKEYEYQRLKALLNAIYGCMCQKLITEEYDYVGGEYKETKYTIEEALKKFYKSRNSFLEYQNAIYITAFARLQLQEMLWKVGPDVVYCDTDSIKYLGDHKKDFEEVNDRIRKEAEEAGAYAESKDGKKYYLGLWDDEGEYVEFKTLGSKKYVYGKYYKDPDTGEEKYKYFSTIAGVSKKAGSEFFTRAGLDAFKDGTTIENSGHLVAFYNDDQIHKITVDGCTFTTASNIALVDDTYTIGITDDYLYVLMCAMDNINHLIYT